MGLKLFSLSSKCESPSLSSKATGLRMFLGAPCDGVLKLGFCGDESVFTGRNGPRCFVGQLLIDYTSLSAVSSSVHSCSY